MIPGVFRSVSDQWVGRHRRHVAQPLLHGARDPEPGVGAEAFVQHVDYVAERVGPEHVGIGLDHVYYLGHKAVQRAGAPDMYPAGYPPSGAAGSYFGPEHLIEIVELLVRRGYGDRDVRAILGGNFLRIASQVWSGGGVTEPTDARCKAKTQGRNA